MCCVLNFFWLSGQIFFPFLVKEEEEEEEEE